MQVFVSAQNFKPRAREATNIFLNAMNVLNLLKTVINTLY